ncbi:MAG: aromatic ring-hydroxylating oxygenase subunit alpha [Acidimicrobiales bacterium]
MKVPFTWQPTGWFMIGWSAEFPPGTAKPLEYLGHHLVAYRTEEGVLHVLDAHCPHLGAHIGHGGKVNGECVECPYHGWGYGPDGINRYIPDEDRPNPSKRLRVWPVDERHEWVFIWHDPHDGPPRWQLPDVWSMLPHLPSEEADYYRAYPELSVKYGREPVHPQITLENAPDSVHFKYVHRATVDPVLIDWKVDGPFYHSLAGWPLPTAKDPDGMAMKINGVSCGVGGSYAVFEGSVHYRLAFFTTPIDDECSDLFYSIWWPRDEGDASPVVPDSYRERGEKEFLQTLWDDLEIWRYQVYVENPAFAPQDARPYGALRKWAKQFYEIEPATR